jgi:hypothetical protein
MRSAASRNEVVAIVHEVSQNASSEQFDALIRFVEELARVSRLRGNSRKVGAVLRLLLHRQSIRPMHTILFGAMCETVGVIKKHSWAERGWVCRFCIGGAAVGLATFGTEAAGLAAMGTAIAVPLWLVTSAGSTMLGVLIEELHKAANKREREAWGAADREREDAAGFKVIQFPTSAN